MNDPYMPAERMVQLTRRALEILAELAFPVHILTKSDLVLRDADLLVDLDRAAASPDSPGAVISFTVTTADDDLAREVEPGAPSPTRRFAALEALAARGLPTGVMLMPVLPFLEDDPEQVAAVVRRAAESGARHVVPGWGVTLRDRQRAHFYEELDARFPGVRPKYEAAFGSRYHGAAHNTPRLEAVFSVLAARYGLLRGVAPYISAVEQPGLF
jgi:DNA repair photolyase